VSLGSQVGCQRRFSTLLLVALQASFFAEPAQVKLPVGTIIPKVICSSDPTETYGPAHWGKGKRKKVNGLLTAQARFALLTLLFNRRLNMYAVLETGSKQYRVSAGDKLEVERLAVDAGQPVTFDRVLLVSNEGKVTVGSPTVGNASVVADVVEHIRGEKKIAFKMKRRKGYHKTIGHRQELTVVQIKEIKI
jgi:large subunit ribosomal protein L21